MRRVVLLYHRSIFRIRTCNPTLQPAWLRGLILGCDTTLHTKSPLKSVLIKFRTTSEGFSCCGLKSRSKAGRFHNIIAFAAVLLV